MLKNDRISEFNPKEDLSDIMEPIRRQITPYIPKILRLNVAKFASKIINDPPVIDSLGHYPGNKGEIVFNYIIVFDLEVELECTVDEYHEVKKIVRLQRQDDYYNETYIQDLVRNTTIAEKELFILSRLLIQCRLTVFWNPEIAKVGSFLVEDMKLYIP